MATVASLFDSQADAEKAVNELDRLEVEPDHIRVLTQESMDRNDTIIGAIANAFSAGDDEISSTLMRMGFGRDEAEFYSEAFDKNAVLVMVETEADREDEIVTLLRRLGGKAYSEG